MKTFFGNLEKREYMRTGCHGYRSIIFDESVELGQAVGIVSDDDTLRVVPTGEKPVEGTEYVFMTKEFGVYNDMLKADISVIFCDDGWMLVTLHSGSFILSHEDGLVQPSVNLDCASVPPVCTSDILWVDADTLLSGKAHFGSELHSRYCYDFEFFLTVSGSYQNGLRHFNCKYSRDRYIDLSRGYIATVEEAILRKEERRKAQMFANMATNSTSSEGLEFEFDDDDDDEYYDEDEDYDDEEYIDM